MELNNDINIYSSSESNISTTLSKHEPIIQNEKENEIENENDLIIYEKSNNYLSEIKEKTHYLFLNYAIYNEKEKLYVITFSKIKKLFNDNKKIFLSNKDFKYNDGELIFKKISKKSNFLNENQFLDFLLNISIKIYDKIYQVNQQEAVTTFFNSLFYRNIEIMADSYIDINDKNNYQYKLLIELFKIFPDDDQKIIINKIELTLLEIYIKYFEDGNENDFDGFKSFLKDFEIIPYILNDTQLTIYYKLSIDNKKNKVYIASNIYKNKGNEFLFNNFCLSIIHFSLLYYKKYIKDNVNNIENEESNANKLIIFLEKLEMSKGVKNFKGKNNKIISKKFTLIPPKDILMLYIGKDVNENVSLMDMSQNTIEKNEKEDFISLNDNLISENINKLENTYLYFVKMSDKLNRMDNMLMGLTSYYKFLSYINLLNEDSINSKSTLNKSTNYLSKCDINIIYSQITRPKNNEKNKFLTMNNQTITNISKISLNKTNISNSFLTNSNNNQITNNNYMDFTNFIKSFEYIAIKLYPNLQDKNQALNSFLKKFIIPNLIESDNNINKSPDINLNKNYEHDNLYNVYNRIDNNEKVKKLLQELSVPIKPYFLLYSTDNGFTISYSNTIKFYKDFNVFPNIINAYQFKEIYSFLIKVQKFNSNNNDTFNTCYLENNGISFNNFIVSIGMIGLLMDIDDNEDNKNDIYKVLYLIQIICLSKGKKICLEKMERNSSIINDKLGNFFLKACKEYPKINSNNEELKKDDKNRIKSIDEIFK